MKELLQGLSLSTLILKCENGRYEVASTVFNKIYAEVIKEILKYKEGEYFFKLNIL